MVQNEKGRSETVMGQYSARVHIVHRDDAAVGAGMEALRSVKLSVKQPRTKRPEPVGSRQGWRVPKEHPFYFLTRHQMLDSCGVLKLTLL